jgi:hypothetical protein
MNEFTTINVGPDRELTDLEKIITDLSARCREPRVQMDIAVVESVERAYSLFNEGIYTAEMMPSIIMGQIHAARVMADSNWLDDLRKIDGVYVMLSREDIMVQTVIDRPVLQEYREDWNTHFEKNPPSGNFTANSYAQAAMGSASPEMLMKHPRLMLPMLFAGMANDEFRELTINKNVCAVICFVSRVDNGTKIRVHYTPYTVTQEPPEPTVPDTGHA